MTTSEEFNSWLTTPEGLNLEFKEAKVQFSRKELANYCAALSNEGGGKLIFGVNNRGAMVGTEAFQGTHHKLSNTLLDELGIRINLEELLLPQGRALIFHVPPNPPGQPVKANKIFWMRAGESLKEMDQATLKQKLNETSPDFSTTIADGLSLNDLDEKAIEYFKQRWAQRSGRPDYLSFSKERLLQAIGIFSDKGLNHACLILFGKKAKLDELLPGSEIIYEWRQNPHKSSYDFRKIWREPFFNIYDDIWSTINDRNLRIPFQEGFIQREVLAFSEKSVREAVLNAVAHRDYTINSQSVIIKASPEHFFIESPGGFLPGITAENIIYRSAWRNRAIAETFEKAGLVERSGQGMDDTYSRVQ
jgi:ATP-dependent DNA helicase RecG